MFSVRIVVQKSHIDVFIFELSDFLSALAIDFYMQGRFPMSNNDYPIKKLKVDNRFHTSSFEKFETLFRRK